LIDNNTIELTTQRKKAIILQSDAERDTEKWRQAIQRVIDHFGWEDSKEAFAVPWWKLLGVILVKSAITKQIKLSVRKAHRIRFSVKK